jgi:hypothetical protein
VPARTQAYRSCRDGRDDAIRWDRGLGKEADMVTQHELAPLHFGRQGALLVILLLLVLGAAIVLAARTPWVLDQPMPPYNWAIVL